MNTMEYASVFMTELDNQLVEKSTTGWMEGNAGQVQYNGGAEVARISKELFHWTDTYTIDVERPEDALAALMVVLAIDAEKCSRN